MFSRDFLPFLNVGLIRFRGRSSYAEWVIFAFECGRIFGLHSSTLLFPPQRGERRHAQGATGGQVRGHANCE